MQCFYPISAWQTEVGEVVFTDRGNSLRSLELPCGRCIGCRLTRSQGWAARVMHEASLHEQTSYITLTYDDAHLPMYGNLNYRDFQLFFKRLRRSVPNTVRFYMCGEYGEATRRPHYHACLFGYDFPDKVYLSKSGSGHDLYSSKTLTKLWPLGRHSIGLLTYESAAYVARYVMKKQTGPTAKEVYTYVDSDGVCHSLEPDFNRMSLRPGIGADWLRLYYPEVVANGSVQMNGRAHPVPRFYANKLKSLAAYDQLLADRSLAAANKPRLPDAPSLRDQEQVTKAALANKRRNFE